MKKTLAIILSAVLLIAAVAMTSFALTQADDGYYEVSSPEDLLLVASDTATYNKVRLVSDINMTGYTWTPFTASAMTFDGNGHTISGLTVTNDGSGDRGLFANSMVSHCTLKNVTFKDCSLTVNCTGKTYVGLVARSDRSSYTGIVLDNVDMTVNHTATGEFIFGGIVGRSDWGDINGTHSYITAEVKDNCAFDVNSVNTTDTFNFGGIIGNGYGDTVVIEKSTVSAVMTGNKTPYALVGSGFWAKCEIDGYTKNNTSYGDFPASGNITKKTGVATVEEYVAMIETINNVNDTASFELIADIDFAGKEFPTITKAYHGIIDGNGYTIKNITYSRDNVSGAAGVIANSLTNAATGIIRNLTIADSDISFSVAEGQEAFIAAFAGDFNRSRVDNCHLVNTKLTVDATKAKKAYVGSMIGRAQFGNESGGSGVEIFNNTTDANTVISVTGTNTVVAGIVGYATDDWWSDLLNLKGCINRATVISEGNTSGVIGYVGKATGAIADCANYGTLTGVNVAGISSNSAGCTLTNVTVDCFMFANGGTATEYGANLTVGNGCSATTRVVTNPLATDSYNAFYQTTTPVDGKASYRVVILADQEALKAISGDAADVMVKVVFTTTTGTKTLTKSLAEYGVYTQVSAGSDVYKAAEGDCLFGCIVTGVPVAEITDVDVTITHGENTVYTTVTAE